MKNNNKIITKKYFDLMVNNITKYSITPQEFIEYYYNLKTAIENQLIKEPLNYLNALYKAKIVHIKTYDEENECLKIYNEISHMIALIIKKQLEDKIDIKCYFDNIINKLTISFKDFCECYELIEIAKMAKIDEKDLLKYSEVLLNSNITEIATYDQDIKINYYKKVLKQFVVMHNNQFEKNLKKI